MTDQLDIILQGVVGSTAYGLNHSESDVDYLGVYMVSSQELFGLKASRVLDTSIVTQDPDSTLHELHKVCRNAIKCNPTILELLFLSDYTISTRIGSELINLRSHFLSEKRVREAYAGYVAAGVMFDDRTAVVHWNTTVSSTTMYKDVDDVIAIHGHGGKTILEFID